MNTNQYRLTGILYIGVIVLAGFSQGYVRGSLFVPDNAISTANNILENVGLFRLGLTTDLIAFIIDAVLSILFYQLLKPFGKTLAMVSSALRLIAHPAIGSLNLLNHFMVLKFLEGGGMVQGFTEVQIQTISYYFLEAHSYGYMIAGGFFGVHCILLGILIYRSSTLPNLLGGLLLGSGAGYLVETFVNFSIPGYESYTALIVGISAAIGEVFLALYLSIKGRRNMTHAD